MLNLAAAPDAPAEAFRNAVAIVPWNIVVVLLLELFFYNLRQMEIEKENARFRYLSLKKQMNPHFLFNCLNVLASLAYEDADKTNLFAKKLSGVYRYLLATAETPSVSVKEELEFVNSYLYLEKIRFVEALQVSIDAERLDSRGKVVPSAVQSLVENALKHNVCSESSPLRIEIRADDAGISVSNRLQLRSSAERNGFGLDNLRRQYSILGREISVSSDSEEFRVRLPYL